jgi:hypothetical protein
MGGRDPVISRGKPVDTYGDGIASRNRRRKEERGGREDGDECVHTHTSWKCLVQIVTISQILRKL